MNTHIDRLGILREKIRQQEMLILIWGPSRPDTNATPEQHKLYAKRLQIKQKLKTTFHKSEVFFGEDPEINILTEGFRGELEKARIQAERADLILVLESNRGSSIEIEYFMPEFRKKIYVLMPNKFLPKKGLYASTLNLLEPEHIIGYTQKEFDNCTLASEIAIKVADSVAMERFLRSLPR